MNVLGLIPARGGSKSVPRKNIRLLCGKPLLQYTTEAALQSIRLSRVILSTEDDEIAVVGRQCGVQVPFLRPAEIAADTTPMLAVVQHALRTLAESSTVFDAVCLLQPTTPLRQASHIDACIDLLFERQVDSVFTVLPVPSQFNPHWVYFEDYRGHLHLSSGEAAPIPRRQDLPPAYYRDGAVYVSRSQVVLDQNSLYGKNSVGYLMDPEHSVNIDTMEDWKRAEQLLGCLKGR